MTMIVRRMPTFGRIAIYCARTPPASKPAFGFVISSPSLCKPNGRRSVYSSGLAYKCHLINGNVRVVVVPASVLL